MNQEKARINLDEMREGFRGKRFCKLVEHHLLRQKQDQRILGIHGTIQMLPEGAKPHVEGLIDRWNERAYDKDFWQMDTVDIFDEITQNARDVLTEAGISYDDETLFNIFNIVVLSYAYSAYDQPKTGEFIGIHPGKFPWLSAISLLYPVSAVFYVSTGTPASHPTIIGYGLSNLGYVMFAAGIFAGTYRIFGLTNRWQVFVCAIIVFMVGTVLSNIGALPEIRGRHTYFGSTHM